MPARAEADPPSRTPDVPTDPFDALDPSARRSGPRVRIAVGAAVVLFVGAVAVAAVMSFFAGGGGEQAAIAPSSSEHGAAGGTGAAEDARAGRGPGEAGEPGADVGTTPLLVHVLGAVARPGLVELAPGARVVDAVASAGGFTAEADPAGVNLARPVVDGEQLVVFAVGEVPPAAASGGGAAASPGAASDGLVHLNTAGLAELDTLPRIGPALAQRILDYREANGPFTSIDQLLDVAGIGDAVFAGLAELVAL
ncbi:competence protein ComEA [Agromyces terreus]|uniref:Competence protein ComEA n=1 Tax=Agromyces terreus TaxID=424795 RepID=A0A9X2H238_9MICO|nr:ComEA family DNA-binding protein [Agromyces terreus]MCP2371736.1 competence protein ComEA [Agromyces terreus]